MLEVPDWNRRAEQVPTEHQFVFVQVLHGDQHGAFIGFRQPGGFDRLGKVVCAFRVKAGQRFEDESLQVAVECKWLSPAVDPNRPTRMTVARSAPGWRCWTGLALKTGPPQRRSIARARRPPASASKPSRRSPGTMATGEASSCGMVRQYPAPLPGSLTSSPATASSWRPGNAAVPPRSQGHPVKAQTRPSWLSFISLLPRVGRKRSGCAGQPIPAAKSQSKPKAKADTGGLSITLAKAIKERLQAASQWRLKAAAPAPATKAPTIKAHVGKAAGGPT